MDGAALLLLPSGLEIDHICAGATALTKRVNALGKRLGIPNLSAHDGRHTWTKRAIQGKTDLRALMDAGGWSTPTQPLLYAESGKITNAGVQLATVEIAEEQP